MNFLAVVGQNSADFLRCFLFPFFHHDVADFLQFGHQFSRRLGNGDAIFSQRGRVFRGGLANAFPAFRLGSGGCIQDDLALFIAQATESALVNDDDVFGNPRLYVGVMGEVIPGLAVGTG